jgi:hypothetical protein
MRSTKPVYEAVQAQPADQPQPPLTESASRGGEGAVNTGVAVSVVNNDNGVIESRDMDVISRSEACIPEMANKTLAKSLAQQDTASSVQKDTGELILLHPKSHTEQTELVNFEFLCKPCEIVLKYRAIRVFLTVSFGLFVGWSVALLATSENQKAMTMAVGEVVGEQHSIPPAGDHVEFKTTRVKSEVGETIVGSQTRDHDETTSVKSDGREQKVGLQLDVSSGKENGTATSIRQMYYMNLDSRTDRNAHMLGDVVPLFKEKNIPFERVSAFRGESSEQELCVAKKSGGVRCRGIVGLLKTNLHILEHLPIVGNTLVFSLILNLKIS